VISEKILSDIFSIGSYSISNHTKTPTSGQNSAANAKVTQI